MVHWPTITIQMGYMFNEIVPKQQVSISPNISCEESTWSIAEIDTYRYWSVCMYIMLHQNKSPFDLEHKLPSLRAKKEILGAVRDKMKTVLIYSPTKAAPQEKNPTWLIIALNLGSLNILKIGPLTSNKFNRTVAKPNKSFQKNTFVKIYITFFCFYML